MLRIYGSANSRALRVVWMAAELELKYEHCDWLPRAPETKTPAYRALNPNGRVPTIDDDGFILSESMAINIYLAKKHNSPLWPADPKQQALAMQWSLWETDRLDRQIVDYVRHTVALPSAERKADIAAAAWKQVEPAFDVLETSLTESTWLIGESFTVADVNVAGALYRALSIDTGKWVRLNHWLKRCWERPAAKATRALREKSEK